MAEGTVTVQLTQQESNYVRYILDNLAEAHWQSFTRAEKLITANHSAEGAFGAVIAGADKAITSIYGELSDYYADLAEKFPTTA